MTDASRIIAGVILLTIVTIEFGGYFMTKIVRGQVPMTDFQKSFARAGHAHAGVLVILSLVGLLYVDQTGLTGCRLWVARTRDPARRHPDVRRLLRLVRREGPHQTEPVPRLLWLGAASLAVGVLTLGIGLIVA